MNTSIRICPTCRQYTLSDVCSCGEKTHPALPPRYSPDDRHAGLIRKAKEQDRKEKGIV